VLDPGKKPNEVAKAVSVMLSIPYREALKRLNAAGDPVSIPFQARHAAENAHLRLTQEGALAIITPMRNTNG